MVKESDKIFDTRVPIVKHLTYAEWHAFINGVYVGFVSFKDKEYDENNGREKHYWRGGFLLGWCLKATLLLLLGDRLFV